MKSGFHLTPSVYAITSPEEEIYVFYRGCCVEECDGHNEVEALVSKIVETSTEANPMITQD